MPINYNSINKSYLYSNGTQEIWYDGNVFTGAVCCFCKERYFDESSGGTPYFTAGFKSFDEKDWGRVGRITVWAAWKQNRVEWNRKSSSRVCAKSTWGWKRDVWKNRCIWKEQAFDSIWSLCISAGQYDCSYTSKMFWRYVIDIWDRRWWSFAVRVEERHIWFCCFAWKTEG